MALKYINIIVLLILCINLYGQSIEIVSPLSHHASVGAANVPTDNNDEPCALIMVEFPYKGAEFSGGYIITNPDSIKSVAGCYKFFVSIPNKKGQSIKVYHEEFGTIEFPIWTNDGKLVGREAYKIVLKGKPLENLVVTTSGQKILTTDKVGTLDIMSSVNDAEVYIDGVKEGTTTNRFDNIGVGYHDLLIKSSGYDNYTTRIEIFEGKTSRVMVNLNKSPEFCKPQNNISENTKTPQAIDLGLPSGTLWADRNLDAISFLDLGGYYTNEQTLYNLGEDWTCPTQAQIRELINKCTWKWTYDQGRYGYKVTGPNGNHIYLPAAGAKNNNKTIDINKYGYYRVAPSKQEKSYFYFTPSLKDLKSIKENNSFPIRAVKKKD